MPQFALRVYRDETGYHGFLDSIGLAHSRTLREVAEDARRLLLAVLGGAFPNRTGVDPAGAERVL